jgi:hydrogenase expression/formation protein HypC
MCLAIPMKVIERENERGKVEQGGVIREVNFAMVPEVVLGDYVLIHAGFAIERLDEQEAQSTLELLRDVIAASESGSTENP